MAKPQPQKGIVSAYRRVGVSACNQFVLNRFGGAVPNFLAKLREVGCQQYKEEIEFGFGLRSNDDTIRKFIFAIFASFRSIFSFAFAVSRWSDPDRDVALARQCAVQLLSRGELQCVWSGKPLDSYAALNAGNVFSGLQVQRIRLHQDQRIPEW